ncbi:MAG: hypothetical protein V6Z86_00110 [Hyphomicrobiales bacterium]
MVADPLQVLYQHPLGYIEIRLSGNGFDARIFSEIRFLRKIVSFSAPNIGARDPWRISSDQERLRKFRKKAIPIRPEEVGFPQLEALCVGAIFYRRG